METNKQSSPVRDKEESKEPGSNTLPPLPPSLLVKAKSQVSTQVMELPDEGKEKPNTENQQLARQNISEYQQQQQMKKHTAEVMKTRPHLGKVTPYSIYSLPRRSSHEGVALSHSQPNFDVMSPPLPFKDSGFRMYPDSSLAKPDLLDYPDISTHFPDISTHFRKKTPLPVAIGFEDMPSLKDSLVVSPHRTYTAKPIKTRSVSGKNFPRDRLQTKSASGSKQYLLQTLDDYYLSICEQVMRESGSMDHTIMHCIFVGPAGVGKSSLLKRLLRMKLDPKRTSTQIAEQSVRLEIIRNVSTTAAQVSGLDWQNMQDLNSQACGLLGQISTKQKKAMSKHTTSKSPDSEPSQFSKTIDFFRKVLKEKGVSGLQQHVSPWTLYLTDSGGQPEFQELLPALVVGPCVFFVVIPLDKDLKRKYTVEYVKPDEHKCMRNYLSSLTIQEDLLRSLGSIASIKYKDKDGNEVKPRIMLVATFKDKVSQEDCQRRLKEIQDIVEETDAFRHGMIVDASETQMAFTINNVSDDESEKDAKEIRDTFQVIADGFKVHTPSSWLIFSILVQYVHAKEAIVSKDKCFEVAQECGIRNETEFEAALQFLYKQTGMLRYYKELSELSQIVIKDPQHLFSRVTHLVEKTFTFKETRSRCCTDNFKKGVFSKMDYEKLTKESSSSKLTPSMLLKLLEHLHVVVPLGDGEKYFMPCAIAHLDEDTGVSHTQSATIPPLLITFKSGYCPQGLFGALVACIANKQVANCTLDLDESQIYRNQICFTLGLYRLLLRITPTYIQTEIISDSTNVSLSPELCTLCNSVRKLIESNITEACKTLCYSDNANYSLSFICQCDQHAQLHPAHLRNDPVRRHIFLCSQSKKNVPVNPECHVWLPEPIITQDPDCQSVEARAEAVFRVKATGDELHFQWQKDRSDLCDGGRYCDTNTDTLHIVDVEEGDRGRYRCIVKNDVGRKPSNEALLTITKSLPPSGTLLGVLQPSGTGTILSEQDLHILTMTLRPAAPQWRTIGGSLGILDSDLTIIQHSPILFPEGSLGYFREMLSQWLKWAPPNHPWPTIEALVVALQNNGQESLAVNLKSVFQQRKVYATPHQTQQPCVQMQTQVQPLQQPPEFTYYPQPQQQGQGYGMPQQDIAMPTPSQMQPAVQQQMPPETHTYQDRQWFYPQPVVRIPKEQTQLIRKPTCFQQQCMLQMELPIAGPTQGGHLHLLQHHHQMNKLQPKPQALQIAPLPQSTTSFTTPAVVSTQFSQPDSPNIQKLDRRRSL